LETMTVEGLADLILEGWNCAMSDSGYVWDKAHREVTAAVSALDEFTVNAAYEVAKGRWVRGDYS